MSKSPLTEGERERERLSLELNQSSSSFPPPFRSRVSYAASQILFLPSLLLPKKNLSSSSSFSAGASICQKEKYLWRGWRKGNQEESTSTQTHTHMSSFLNRSGLIPPFLLLLLLLLLLRSIFASSPKREREEISPDI